MQSDLHVVTVVLKHFNFVKVFAQSVNTTVKRDETVDLTVDLGSVL